MYNTLCVEYTKYTENTQVIHYLPLAAKRGAVALRLVPSVLFLESRGELQTPLESCSDPLVNCTVLVLVLVVTINVSVDLALV